MRKLAVLIIAMGVVACSSAGGNGDGGHDGGQDAGDAGDAGDGGQDAGDAGGDRPDVDVSSEFVLVIPPGTSLCNRFSIGRNWLQEHAMRGMVDMKAGSYVLEREAGFSEADIVQSVRFGTRDNLVPEVGTPGELEVEFRQEVDDSYWYYRFRKAYLLGGEEYNLEVRLPVRQVGGEWPKELVLDPEFATWTVEAQALIGAGVDPDQIQYFDPCDLASAPRICTVTGAGGTVLELELRTCLEPPEYCAGCTICYYLSRAGVTLGAYQEEVTDHFRLTYSAMHHNINPHHLVVLDQPQEGVAALLIDNTLCFTDYLIHLDADLLEIGREAIVDCQYAAP